MLAISEAWVWTMMLAGRLEFPHTHGQPNDVPDGYALRKAR